MTSLQPSSSFFLLQLAPVVNFSLRLIVSHKVAAQVRFGDGVPEFGVLAAVQHDAALKVAFLQSVNEPSDICNHGPRRLLAVARELGADDAAEVQAVHFLVHDFVDSCDDGLAHVNHLPFFFRRYRNVLLNHI